MPETQRPPATGVPADAADAPSVHAAADTGMPITGTARVTVTTSPDWPFGRPSVDGWVPPGSGLAALVDLGSTTWAEPQLCRYLAEAVQHATRVTIIGDHPGGVAAIVRVLPAAIAELRELERVYG